MRCSKEPFLERRRKKKRTRGSFVVEDVSRSRERTKEERGAGREMPPPQHKRLGEGRAGLLQDGGGFEPTRVPVTNDLLESREGLWEGVRSDLRAVRKESEGEVFGGEQKCFTKQVHKGEEDLCGIKFFRSLLPLRWRWPGRQLNDYDFRANRGWPELPGAFGAVVGWFA